MPENPTPDDTGANEVAARAAISAFVSASDAALASTRALDAAWREHLRLDGPEPPADWIAEVAAQQVTSASALVRARQATRRPLRTQAAGAAGVPDFGEVTTSKVKRRRRRQNKFLSGIGPRGLLVLHGGLFLLLAASIMMATGAAISLALEAAGFLQLIDDPVQLPVLNQLAMFVVFVASAFVTRRLLKPVQRALYGSRAIRLKTFRL